MPPPIAVVTGASGGLGSQLCGQLASHGISLVLLDRNDDKARAFARTLEATRSGSVAGTFAVDLSSHADIRRCSGQIVAAFPAVQYLFNNAGLLPERLEFSGHGNELDFEVNALAPLQLVDGLRPALVNAGGATVVNTSAGLSLQATSLDWNDLVRPQTFTKLFGPYVKSKAALNVITTALARELAADRIIVRAVDPGPNRTRLTKGAGTPLWMRLFFAFLPSPDKGARKLYDGALSSKWEETTGAFISGGRFARSRRRSPTRSFRPSSCAAAASARRSSEPAQGAHPAARTLRGWR